MQQATAWNGLLNGRTSGVRSSGNAGSSAALGHHRSGLGLIVAPKDRFLGFERLTEWQVAHGRAMEHAWVLAGRTSSTGHSGGGV